MCTECEKSLPNQIVFEKIESIIRQMQDEQNGLPVKTAKSFMQKIPSVFTGSDLIQWLMKNLRLDDITEAIHLANLIASHGYIFPIEDHVLIIKNDYTFYRFQTPCLWPSNNTDPENTDYAVYLCKRTMQGKTRLELADYEAENLARLQKMFSRKWEFIFMQAESQAKIDKKRDKLERKVLDSQERAFWDLYRPVPGCVNTTELDIKKACRLSKTAKRCAGCLKKAAAAAASAAAALEQANQGAQLGGPLNPEPLVARGDVTKLPKSVKIFEEDASGDSLKRPEVPSNRTSSGELRKQVTIDVSEAVAGQEEESSNRSASASDSHQEKNPVPTTSNKKEEEQADDSSETNIKPASCAAKTEDETKIPNQEAESTSTGTEAASTNRAPEQAAAKKSAGHHHHGHHHHHHHHHHHPHQPGQHHHHHHHHHRQCPHHKHSQQAGGKQPQRQFSIPAEGATTDQQTTASEPTSSEIDKDKDKSVLGRQDKVRTESTASMEQAQGVEAGGGEATTSKKCSPGFMDSIQFMRAPSVGSATGLRRKSECNRMMSMNEDGRCGFSELDPREREPRPASACCSSTSSQMASDKKLTGRQELPQSANSRQCSTSNQSNNSIATPAPANQQMFRKSSLNILRSSVSQQESSSTASVRLANYQQQAKLNLQHSPLKGTQSVFVTDASAIDKPTTSTSSSLYAGGNNKRNMNDLERELESLKLRLDRRISGVKMSKVTQSYLSYFKQWAEYDPFIAQPIPSNPWISDSTELWDSERQTKDVHCRRVRRWAFSLKELLSDPAGREQFHKFLEKEFSAENLKFWDAVQELKRVHSRDVSRRVEAIWTEYLAPDANCPINIDSKSYETSKRNMAKNKNNRYIFDEAAGHVYQLMKNDSYPRYLRSDMYKDYKDASEKRRTTNQVAFDVFKPQITTLKHKFNF